MSKKKAVISAIVVLLVCLAVLLVVLALQPPASFRRAISTADRIEVEGYKSKIVVTGEEAKEAARSLGFGFNVLTLWCHPYIQVRFYRGTNLLTKVGICFDRLFINGHWYTPTGRGKRLIRSWSERLTQTSGQRDLEPSYEEFVSAHVFPYVAPAGRQTLLRQNYSRLSVNLTKNQILEILGKPDYSRELWSKSVPRKYVGTGWTYFFEKPNPTDSCII